MPQYIAQALFIWTGLMLTALLLRLLPDAPGPGLRGLIHAVTGLAALLMANTAGGLFCVGIGLNALTLPVSAGLGVPGVALLWALRYFL